MMSPFFTPPVEIANDVPKSGTRLDAIVIGMLVWSLHATEL
jgi:hypothetical protein